MTRDEIIRMAMDAGLYSGNPRVPGTGNMILTRLQRFASLVAAAEREECAKVCDELAHKQRDYMLFEDADGCDLCAEAIRARGK